MHARESRNGIEWYRNIESSFSIYWDIIMAELGLALNIKGIPCPTPSHKQNQEKTVDFLVPRHFVEWPALRDLNRSSSSSGASVSKFFLLKTEPWKICP